MLNDKVAGYGRLIHADGDVYQGYWSNEQADGFGVYSHANGAIHRGFWRQDK